MKAFLLAAGLGTRLKPLTDTTPKCLIPVCGVPLIHIWLEAIEKAGITELLINTHLFPDMVEETVLKRNNKINIIFSYEEKLLGSGGTISANYDFVKDEENFFMIYADNLTNVSLNDLTDFHLQKKSIYTTYVYHTNVPTQKGIFVSDENGKVIDFEEKPKNPKSNLANAGIGILNRKIFNYLAKNQIQDFGSDVLPKIIGNMYIKITDAYIRDIGTLLDYEEAQKEWEKLINKNDNHSDTA